METIKDFLGANPHYFGLIMVVAGIGILISAIMDAEWLFGDVNRLTYDTRKLDGIINWFGRKTGRIAAGISAVVIIFYGAIWFLLSII